MELFIETIDSEHPEYVARKPLLNKYRDLYLGGEHIRSKATEYLVKRQKEPLDVYQERLSRVFYENYAGSILDWYVATLFRREPVVLAEGDDARGRGFLASFVEDCDLQGSSLADFFRRQMLEALVCGSSHVLVDFPRVEKAPESLAEEERAGAGRAYLSGCTAEQLINWSANERGQFDWVVMRSSFLRKNSVALSAWTRETRWMYFDRQNFQTYRRAETANKPGLIELVDQGQHGFARLNQVPLFSLRLPEGLWLMNRAGLLQIEHFNKSNALGWALTLGLFATPVIYSDKEWSQVLGDSYYLQLGPQDRFGWTEPEGKVYQIAAENLDRLKEEIYRVCYLMTQAGGPLGQGHSQSGLSKQRDFAVTQEVLRMFGDIVKDAMKRVLGAVLRARQDEITVGVAGVDEFDIGEFTAALGDAEQLLKLGIESPTLKKQIFKKLAFQYLCDVKQDTKDAIAREIDAMEESRG